MRLSAQLHAEDPGNPMWGLDADYLCTNNPGATLRTVFGNPVHAGRSGDRPGHRRADRRAHRPADRPPDAEHSAPPADALGQVVLSADTISDVCAADGGGNGGNLTELLDHAVAVLTCDASPATIIGLDVPTGAVLWTHPLTDASTDPTTTDAAGASTTETVLPGPGATSTCSTSPMCPPPAWPAPTPPAPSPPSTNTPATSPGPSRWRRTTGRTAATRHRPGNPGTRRRRHPGPRHPRRVLLLRRRHRQTAVAPGHPGQPADLRRLQPRPEHGTGRHRRRDRPHRHQPGHRQARLDHALANGQSAVTSTAAATPDCSSGTPTGPSPPPAMTPSTSSPANAPGTRSTRPRGRTPWPPPPTSPPTSPGRCACSTPAAGRGPSGLSPRPRPHRSSCPTRRCSSRPTAAR